MTTQPPNSPNSRTDTWKCTGISTKSPHSETINNKDENCKMCGKTYNDYKKENEIAIGQRILLSSSGILTIVALCLGLSAFVYAKQKFDEADRSINLLQQTKAEVVQVNIELEKAKQELKTAKEILKRIPELENSLADTQKKLILTKTELETTQSKLEQTNKTLTQNKNELQKKTQQITEGIECIKLMGEIDNIIWEGITLNPDGVIKIQQTLKSIGFYTGKIDGTFAEITRQAVNDYKRKCELQLTQP